MSFGCSLFALIRRELVEWNVNEHVKFGIQKFSTLSPPTQCDSWGFASFFSLSHFLNFSRSLLFFFRYILTFSSCCWRGEWGMKLGHKPHLRWESFQCTSTRWIFFWWFTHSANGLCSTNTPTKTSTELVIMEFEWSRKISTSQLAKTFLSYIFTTRIQRGEWFLAFHLTRSCFSCGGVLNSNINIHPEYRARWVVRSTSSKERVESKHYIFVCKARKIRNFLSDLLSLNSAATTSTSVKCEMWTFANNSLRMKLFESGGWDETRCVWHRLSRRNKIK